MTKLQILGLGCAKCEMLTRHTEEAAQALGLEYTLEKVTSALEITKPQGPSLTGISTRSPSAPALP